MTSPTPKTGVVGTLFGINVYGRLYANHWYQNKHHTGVHIENIRGGVAAPPPFGGRVTKNGSGGRGLTH